MKLISRQTSSYKALWKLPNATLVWKVFKMESWLFALWNPTYPGGPGVEPIQWYSIETRAVGHTLDRSPPNTTRSRWTWNSSWPTKKKLQEVWVWTSNPRLCLQKWKSKIFAVVKLLYNCEDLFHFYSLSAIHSYDLYHIHFTSLSVSSKGRFTRCDWHMQPRYDTLTTRLRHVKSRRILKHALKPYDNRGLKSVVSVW